jgi:BirA family transcriptional regulator, biotin operon repressor / biotin---[acetyl-CoA-carboxylase] ligase
MNKYEVSITGRDIYYYQTVDSTNLAIRRLAEEGAASGSIVIADEQLAGRGRLGRSWFSPPDSGLWFSILLRPRLLSPPDASPLTLVTAAILAENLNSYFHLPVKIKWPNDLLIEGKKTGGILTESKVTSDHIEYLIVGIGLNVNQKQTDFPAEINQSGTSLYLAGGREIDRIALFQSLKKDLLKGYPLFFKDGFSPFRNLWIKHNITLGRQVTINRAGGKLKGQALDLTEAGTLLIEDKDRQIHPVSSGEISQ